MARDLDISIKIVACPMVREDDGLAFSSRDVRFSREERWIAPILVKVLFDIATELTAEARIETQLEKAKSAVLAGGYDRIEYLELRAEDNLSSISTLDALRDFWPQPGWEKLV